MARMKTGRLTTKTTPPQKNNGGTPNKVQWADPKNPPKASNQAEWDKYDQDYKAYKNYDNEVNAYNKQMEAYKKSKLKGPADYRALDSGNTSSSNMRKLDPSELSEFNAYMKKNNPDSPDYGWVNVSKDTKRGQWGSFMGDVAKPTAPVKREQPKVPEILDKMPIRKPEPIKTKKTGIKTREEAPAPEKFVNPGKSVKDVKVRYRAPLVGNSGKRDYGIAGKGPQSKNKSGATLKAGKVEKSSKKTYNTGYKREEKQFKAYAGQTATGDSFLDMTPKDIKAYRKEAKSIRAEYRKQPDSDTKSMGKAAMTSEIRQSRKAEKFSEKVYDFKGKGGVKHFNDKNYGGNIIKDYRASEDNANNRNNMTNKLKAIGDKTSKRLSELEKSTRGGFQYNQVNQ
jgi:hypothetical protein